MVGRTWRVFRWFENDCTSGDQRSHAVHRAVHRGKKERVVPRTHDRDHTRQIERSAIRLSANDFSVSSDSVRAIAFRSSNTSARNRSIIALRSATDRPFHASSAARARLTASHAFGSWRSRQSVSRYRCSSGSFCVLMGWRDNHECSALVRREQETPNIAAVRSVPHCQSGSGATAKSIGAITKTLQIAPSTTPAAVAEYEPHRQL